MRLAAPGAARGDAARCAAAAGAGADEGDQGLARTSGSIAPPIDLAVGSDAATRPDARAHPGPPGLRRPDGRSALRRRPRAAAHHSVDRLRAGAGPAAAAGLPRLAGPGAGVAGPGAVAGARPGDAVVARPDRRAARPPRASASTRRGGGVRGGLAGAYEVGYPAPVDPPAAGTLRPGPVQPDAGGAGDPRCTWSCWSRAATPSPWTRPTAVPTPPSAAGLP